MTLVPSPQYFKGKKVSEARDKWCGKVDRAPHAKVADLKMEDMKQNSRTTGLETALMAQNTLDSMSTPTGDKEFPVGPIKGLRPRHRQFTESLVPESL